MKIKIIIIILLLSTFLLKGIYIKDNIDNFANIEENETIVEESSFENESLLTSVAISDKETTLLKQIYDYMKANEFDRVARFIIDKEEELDLFYTKTLLEKEHYFDGENLYLSGLLPSKEYLVIGDISTFYFGYIIDGKANGYGLKLNAYRADYERYTYASGVWKAGKLNGNGKTGSIVLDLLSDRELSAFVLSGEFIEDELDGAVRLTIIEDGEVYTYDFNVSFGIINKDEILVEDELENIYLISSNEDENKKFSIKESELLDKKWINKLEF